MKTYRAGKFDTMVIVHEDGKPQRDLSPRLDLRRYATGYDWGAVNNGSRQLSLALLCDALEDDERAVRLHDQFTTYRIAKLDRDAGILLSSDTIRLDCRLMEDRAKREAAE